MVVLSSIDVILWTLASLFSLCFTLTKCQSYRLVSFNATCFINNFWTSTEPSLLPIQTFSDLSSSLYWIWIINLVLFLFFKLLLECSPKAWWSIQLCRLDLWLTQGLLNALSSISIEIIRFFWFISCIIFFFSVNSHSSSCMLFFFFVWSDKCIFWSHVLCLDSM